VAVVASFFFCWSPYHARRVASNHVTSYSPEVVLRVYVYLTYISGITYYMTATINPILYQLLSLKFRLAFRDTFGFWPPFLRPDHLPELTATSTCVSASGQMETPSIKCSSANKKYLSANGSFNQMPATSPAIRKNQAFFSDQLIQPKSPSTESWKSFSSHSLSTIILHSNKIHFSHD